MFNINNFLFSKIKKIKIEALILYVIKTYLTLLSKTTFRFVYEYH